MHGIPDGVESDIECGAAMDGFFVAARDLADAELVRVAQREQFGTGLEGERLLRSGHANLVAVVPNKPPPMK